MRVDKYLKKDGMQDRWYLYELYCTNNKWEVFCWKVEPHANQTEPTTDGPWGSIEHCWTVTGKTVGYKDGNPNRPIQERFTEETAREEFERWRS